MGEEERGPARRIHVVLMGATALSCLACKTSITTVIDPATNCILKQSPETYRLKLPWFWSDWAQWNEPWGNQLPGSPLGAGCLGGSLLGGSHSRVFNTSISLSLEWLEFVQFLGSSQGSFPVVLMLHLNNSANFSETMSSWFTPPNFTHAFLAKLQIFLLQFYCKLG